MIIPTNNVNNHPHGTTTDDSPPININTNRQTKDITTKVAGSFAPSNMMNSLNMAFALPFKAFAEAISSLEKGTSFGATTMKSNVGVNANTDDNKKRKKRSKDSLWEGLIQMFVGMLQLPGKFKHITNAIDGAGKTLAFGLDGLILSTYLAIKDIAILVFSIIIFIAKYFTCIIQFFVTLPFCFVSHIMWCIWRIVYLIFPFTSCMCWYATGYELMPYYDQFFEVLDDADDTFVYPLLGFYLTKFPPSIVKLCYTCNNKVLRLKDVSKDTNPIVRAGKQFGYDMGVKAPRYMRPAKPHMYKVAVNIDKLFK